MGLGHGFAIADEAFDFELFQLACAFAASKELARLGETHQGIADLRGTFEQSEAARRLIAIAVMVRNKLDTRTVLSPGQLDETSAQKVGDLTEDKAGAEQRKPLTFREACNKIIHADSVDLTAEPDESGSDLLSPTITLWGTLKLREGECEWKAKLDLPQFVDVASRL